MLTQIKFKVSLYLPGHLSVFGSLSILAIFVSSWQTDFVLVVVLKCYKVTVLSPPNNIHMPLRSHLKCDIRTFNRIMLTVIKVLDTCLNDVFEDDIFSVVWTLRGNLSDQLCLVQVIS